LREEKSAAELLITQLRNVSDAEARELLYQIRHSEENVDSIAESIRRTVKIPHKTDSEGLEGDYSQFHSKTYDGQNFGYGMTSNLGFVSTESEYNPRKVQISRAHLPNTWTDVTKDVDFINHLLRLYFTWCNAFYAIIYEPDFYHDMETGETNYCSSLLVNSMCSIACSFTDLPAGRTNAQDPTTSGDQFFEAARLQLFKDETSCLTTVQALAIMGTREVSKARDSLAFAYAGRCMRMAIELGLHLEVSPSEGLSEAQAAVRNRVFWGLYTYDT
jgi:hypothetical protein